MVIRRHAPPAHALASHVLAWKNACDQIHISDKELLDSGYMSDCTVICGNSKWATHKVILCSRNKWFCVALSGGFNEASTGVVAIEDTDPVVVHAVLDIIYTGATYCDCSTAADLVEMWKAGDFFGVSHLCQAAEYSMTMRLERSSSRLKFDSNNIPSTGKGCRTITAVHKLCGHSVQEIRVCPVSRSEGNITFRVREPEILAIRDNVCELCEKRMRNEELLPTDLNRLREATNEFARLHSPLASTDSLRTDPETRHVVKCEIQELCEALNLALNDTPEGSPMHRMLLSHVCNTPVTTRGGLTVCRFLEKESSAA